MDTQNAVKVVYKWQQVVLILRDKLIGNCFEIFCTNTTIATKRNYISITGSIQFNNHWSSDIIRRPTVIDSLFQKRVKIYQLPADVPPPSLPKMKLPIVHRIQNFSNVSAKQSEQQKSTEMQKKAP